MSLTIGYKGEKILEQQDSCIKSMATKNRYLEDDITFVYEGGGPDTSDATAQPEDILNGATAYVNGEKITGTATSPILINKTITQNGIFQAQDDNVDGYSEVNIEVPTQGETKPSELNLDKVSFVDYDGVLVADYTLAEIQQMTSEDELPTPPPHDRITFVGWNWTLAQLKAENRPIIVGAIQKATANALELDIVTYDGGLDIGLSLGLDGTATVEWGDSQSETVTHSGGYQTSIEVTHSYSEAGDYTIVVTPTSGTLGGKYDQYPAIFDTTKGLAANDYAAQIRHLRGVRIGDFSIRYQNDFYRTFAYSQIHSIAQNGANCDLRDSEIVFANHSAMDCRDIVSCSLPPNTTQINSYAFSGDYSLGYVTMPSTVTTILSSAFQNCFGLQYIRIPNSVTDFRGLAFPACRGVRTYDFREWSIADLQACTFGANIFQNITANTQLLFATQAIAEEAKVTTNLSTYASYITYEENNTGA